MKNNVAAVERRIRNPLKTKHCSLAHRMVGSVR